MFSYYKSVADYGDTSPNKMTGTERKCFSKYYPADFDPSKIPRQSSSGPQKIVQRVMVPFNMQCNSCSEYIYKGRKFNMDRETVKDEDYLGLKLFRFHMKCPNCLASIAFRTDLENCDYKNEHGATRLDEGAGTEVKNFGEDSEEDVLDPMILLEKRTKQSRKEMKNQEELEDLLESSSGKEGVDAIGILKAEEERKREMAKEEEDRMVKEVLESGQKKIEDVTTSSSSLAEWKTSTPVKRKNEQKERFAGIKLVKKSAGKSSEVKDSEVKSSSSSSLISLISGYESE